MNVRRNNECSKAGFTPRHSDGFIRRFVVSIERKFPMFEVVNSQTKQVIEKHYTEAQAILAVSTLNKQEIKSGRKPIYTYKKAGTQ